MLDERDALFAELRHSHFAAAAMRISSQMDEFREKNKVGQGGLWGPQEGGGLGQVNPCKHICQASFTRTPALLALFCTAAAQVASKGRAVGDMDMKGMSKLIQQLPQYRCAAWCSSRAVQGAH